MSSALRGFVVGGVLGVAVMGGGALAVAQTTGTTPGTAPGTTIPKVDDTAPDGTVPPATGQAPAPTAPGDGQAKTPGDCDEGGGGHGRGHGKGMGLGHSAEALAAELGITVDKLTEAGKAAHQAVQDQLGEPTRPATRPPSDEDRQKMEADRKARKDLHDKVLAEKLGITVDRLHEAEANVAKKRLDEAVANGKLTQQQADELLQKLRNGEEIGPGLGMGGGPRGGPGGPGGGKGHMGGKAGKGGRGSGSTPGTTTPPATSGS